MIRRWLAAALLPGFLVPGVAAAHPMPYSAVFLDAGESSVAAELRIPAEELMLAAGPDLRAYLGAHLRAATAAGRPWHVAITSVESEQPAGSYREYREVVAHAVLTPPAGEPVRRFLLRYDAVVHQVVTHRVLVSARAGEARQTAEVVVDNRTMTVPPLLIDLGRPEDGPGG